ncbi:hypothetical protein AZE42_11638 [Rhizopogon vesiculosus]|uniref:Retrovirus-related Pol polyprotein from transposon TNT 1-94-like beta-barrel domain-containing protein n=1 Tax=Rhizopogon vesiculosus TaxID=180088 RepID=A0A1J8PNX7_9AGAM|nr:hypothetical protein AZE42_11638 [Rhizopogon vesiculosus]
MADRSRINATGKGDVKLNLPNGESQTMVTLKNALYVPNMTYTLISTNHITAAGFSIVFEDKTCKLLSPPPKQAVIAIIPHINGLYSISANFSHANLTKTKLTINQLH